MADSKYKEALDAFKDHVDQLHALVHDPFKAPELTVMATRETLAKVWELQIEYAAMIRKPEADR